MRPNSAIETRQPVFENVFNSTGSGLLTATITVRPEAPSSIFLRFIQPRQYSFATALALPIKSGWLRFSGNQINTHIAALPFRHVGKLPALARQFSPKTRAAKPSCLNPDTGQHCAGCLSTFIQQAGRNIKAEP